MAPDIQLDPKQFRNIARALADPRRVQILRHIGESKCDCPCSSVLASQDVSPATLSHHMKELETAGLIDAVREGKTMQYSLRRDVLKAYLKELAKI